MKMKHGGNSIVWLSVGCALVAGFNATAFSPSTDTPYQAIVIRNVFGLREQPLPPPTGPTVQPTPPPNVKLKGVTDILGFPQGVFEVQPVGKQAETFILGENERKDFLELVKINLSNPEKRSATIRLEGRDMTLDLDVPKAPAGPPAAGAQMVASGLPRPGQPTFQSAGVNYTPQPTPGVPTPNIPSYATPNAAASPYSTVTQRRDVRSTQEAALTPEQQIVLIEAQRAQALRQGDSIAKILPPTPLTPMVMEEAAAAQQQPTFPAPPTRGALPPVLRPRTTGTMVPPVINQ